MIRPFALLILTTALLVVIAASAPAQTFTVPPGLAKRASSPSTKLRSGLAELFEQRSQAQGTAVTPPPLPLRVRNQMVLIDAVASGGTQALRSELEGLGGQQLRVFRSTISGWFPVDALDDLAALGSLQFARPALMQTNGGLTTSQGDAAMAADAMRSTLSVDGTGVTVGTLSDSFDALGDAATDVTNGDLPSGIVVLEDFAMGSDEGRAMMQLIADVAPGAGQAFHTAHDGMADFALGIEELAGCPSGSEAGCTTGGVAADIIVDDVSYYAEPMFQDGIISQAVDVVKGAGVAYFSSAGNASRQSYEISSGYVPSATAGPSGNPLHDFDPGPGDDPLQSITVPVGQQVIFTFQWDSPFFSVSGAPGSPNDMDIYIVGSGPGDHTLLAGSADFNVSGDAVEVFGFTNTGTIDIDGVAGPDTEFNIIIDYWDGPNPGRMKYIYFNNTVTVNEFATASGTIFGHPAAVGARAVGAAFYGDTPLFGTNPPLLEFFSSAGPAKILFDTAGSPVDVDRAKPEIVAPDGTNTTFFGFDVEPDTFPNFFGTSAAAPHAAGLAALLLDNDPMLTPDGIYGALEMSALDMNVMGFDYESGFGFIRSPFICFPDVFEPDNSSGEASPLVSGITQAHGICPAGEEDWTTFSLILPSQVEVGTSGPAGDTRMWLRDDGLSEVEFDDNDGAGSFSFIDRVCGVDELPAGTYYVQVDESGDDDEIASYDIDLSVTSCCVTDLVLANQTITGTLTAPATSTASLGPNLIVDGDYVAINAPVVSIYGPTQISGTFSIGNTPACP